MVTEVDEGQVGAQGGTTSMTTTTTTITGGGQVGTQQSARGIGRDRWGDIYTNMPVKRMIALYDYDPQELSPNVDAEVCSIVIFN